MISIIVALDQNRAIGKHNALPWYLPADLARFKALTTGHPIIMGRKTYDSISRPLPKRTNIVITRNTNWHQEEVFKSSDLVGAIEIAKRNPGAEEIFIIGGGEIFKAAIDLADKLYVTEVEAAVPGADIFFPEIRASMWQEIERVHHTSDEKNKFDYNFVTYERR